MLKLRGLEKGTEGTVARGRSAMLAGIAGSLRSQERFACSIAWACYENIGNGYMLDHENF